MSCAVAMTTSASPSRRGGARRPAWRRVDGGRGWCRSPPVLKLLTQRFPLPVFGRTSPTYLLRIFLENLLCGTDRGVTRSAASSPVAGPASAAVLAARTVKHLPQQRQEAPPLGVVERVAPGHLRRELRISRSFAAMPSGVSTRFLTRRSRWLGSRRTKPCRSSVSAMRRDERRVAPHALRQLLHREPAVQLEQGEQVVRCDTELGRDRVTDRPGLLDQRGERVEDVPVQRRCRVFSPRRVRSLDLNAHDWLNS